MNVFKYYSIGKKKHTLFYIKPWLHTGLLSLISLASGRILDTALFQIKSNKLKGKYRA